MPSSRASLGSNTVADTWRRHHFQRPQRDAAQYVLVQLRHPAVNALMLPYHSPSATNVFDVEPGGTSQHKEPNDDRRKPPIWMLRDQSCASPKSIVGSTRHAGGIYLLLHACGDSGVVTHKLVEARSWMQPLPHFPHRFLIICEIVLSLPRCSDRVRLPRGLRCHQSVQFIVVVRLLLEW